LATKKALRLGPPVTCLIGMREKPPILWVVRLMTNYLFVFLKKVVLYFHHTRYKKEYIVVIYPHKWPIYEINPHLIKISKQKNVSVDFVNALATQL